MSGAGGAGDCLVRAVGRNFSILSIETGKISPVSGESWYITQTSGVREAENTQAGVMRRWFCI